MATRNKDVDNSPTFIAFRSLIRSWGSACLPRAILLAVPNRHALVPAAKESRSQVFPLTIPLVKFQGQMASNQREGFPHCCALLVERNPQFGEGSRLLPRSSRRNCEMSPTSSHLLLGHCSPGMTEDLTTPVLQHIRCTPHLKCRRREHYSNQ